MDAEGGMAVAGVGDPATFAQLMSWFPDDEACASYLARLRWPDGFRCPRCRHHNHEKGTKPGPARDP